MWAALIDVNRERFRRGAPPIGNFQGWCREITGVPLGELARICAEGIAKRYCDAFMQTARRKRRGERARYRATNGRCSRCGSAPARSSIRDRRVRLAVARSAPPLWVRLARSAPYPIDQVRSVTLVVDGGRLCLDVTAAVPVEDHGLDAGRVAASTSGSSTPSPSTWTVRRCWSRAARYAPRNASTSPTRKARQRKMSAQGTASCSARQPPMAPAACRGTPGRGPPSPPRPPSTPRSRDHGDRLGPRPPHRHTGRRRSGRDHPPRRRPTSEPASSRLAAHSPDGRAHRQSHPRRHQHRARRRTPDLLDLPRMQPARPQAHRTTVPMPPLWASRAPRPDRSPQHRRPRRRNHEHPRARHAPSSRHTTCTA